MSLIFLRMPLIHFFDITQASGITSIIKVVMMLRELQIPPQPNWPFKFNPKFPPLATSNVKISTKISTLRASLKGDKRIKMLVNSFDASVSSTRGAWEQSSYLA